MKVMFFVGTFFSSRAMSLSVLDVADAGVHGERLGGGLGQLQQLGGAGEGVAGAHLAHQRAQELLLHLDAVQVALVAEAVPGADEGEGLLALDVRLPAGRFSCDFVSSTALARQTSTPPTAVVSVFTALKSAIMKWSSVMPVTALTVRMVQPGSRPLLPEAGVEADVLAAAR